MLKKRSLFNFSQHVRMRAMIESCEEQKIGWTVRALVAHKILL